MTLDQQSPYYVQIRESLRRRIEGGEYGVDRRLPSESELESMFGVSRITVRQAMRDLEADNLIVKLRGKGTFVLPIKAAQNANYLRGFGEAMSEQGYLARNVVNFIRQTPATKEVAHRLGVRVGMTVIELERLRLLDDVPISVDHSFFPRKVGLRLFKVDLETRDVFEVLETDLRISLGSASLEIEAVKGRAALCRLLSVPAGSPILKVDRTTRATSGVAIDFEHLYYRADRFRYQVNVGPDVRSGWAASPCAGTDRAD